MGQVRDGFCLQIAGGAQLQGDLPLGQLLQQALLLYGPHPVADALGPQLQGLADALRPGGLPSVESKGHLEGAGAGEQGGVLPGGIEGLCPSQIQGTDPLAQKTGGSVHRLPVGGLFPAPHAAEDQLAEALSPSGLPAGEGGLHHLALDQALAGVLAGSEPQLGVEEPLGPQFLHQLLDGQGQGPGGLEQLHRQVETAEIVVEAGAVRGDREQVPQPLLLWGKGDVGQPGQLAYRLKGQRAVDVQVQVNHGETPPGDVFSIIAQNRDNGKPSGTGFYSPR